LLAYTCGTFFSYALLPFIFMPLTLLFLVGTMFHPESAHYLIKKDRNEAAEISIKFYRGFRSNNVSEHDTGAGPTERVKIEFENIKSLINERTGGKKFDWHEFLSRPARKVLIIGVGLMYLEQFSGVFALLFYVATIFERSGSSLSPTQSSIVVGVIQLVGAWCSTMFVDKAGRRFLIGASSFGIAVGMFVFALFNFLDRLGHMPSYLNWIPLVSFSFVLWIANLGVLTLPFLVMSELMITLPNIKQVIYTFCLCLSWTFAFVILKYLEAILDQLDISGLMLIFSINSLLGGIFVMWYVPETKGKSIQEILETLEK